MIRASRGRANLYEEHKAILIELLYATTCEQDPRSVLLGLTGQISVDHTFPVYVVRDQNAVSNEVPLASNLKRWSRSQGRLLHIPRRRHGGDFRKFQKLQQYISA